MDTGSDIVGLALASVALASFNGSNLIELVAKHHAIGILNALILTRDDVLCVLARRIRGLELSARQGSRIEPD